MTGSGIVVVSTIQLGFGGVGVDLLATVAAFPNPDDKIRTTNLKVFAHVDNVYTFVG